MFVLIFSIKCEIFEYYLSSDRCLINPKIIISIIRIILLQHNEGDINKTVVIFMMEHWFPCSTEKLPVDALRKALRVKYFALKYAAVCEKRGGAGRAEHELWFAHNVRQNDVTLVYGATTRRHTTYQRFAIARAAVREHWANVGLQRRNHTYTQGTPAIHFPA